MKRDSSSLGTVLSGGLDRDVAHDKSMTTKIEAISDAILENFMTQR
jgi:hypothetical protein